MREYSSHSPGRARGGSGSTRSERSTSRSSAVRIAAPCGAEAHAIATLSTIRTAAMVSDCQVRIVAPKSSTPVISSSSGGSDAGVACSWAAEDERPSAQTAPRPRYAAAPSAR